MRGRLKKSRVRTLKKPDAAPAGGTEEVAETIEADEAARRIEFMKEVRVLLEMYRDRKAKLEAEKENVNNKHV